LRPVPADFLKAFDLSNEHGDSNGHVAQHERQIGNKGDLITALAYPTHVLKGNKAGNPPSLMFVDGNHPQALTVVVMLHYVTGALTLPTTPYDWAKSWHYTTGRPGNEVLISGDGSQYVAPAHVANKLQSMAA
jgi:hypothetical protein